MAGLALASHRSIRCPRRLAPTACESLPVKDNDVDGGHTGGQYADRAYETPLSHLCTGRYNYLQKTHNNDTAEHMGASLPHRLTVSSATRRIHRHTADPDGTWPHVTSTIGQAHRHSPAPGGSRCVPVLCCCAVCDPSEFQPALLPLLIPDAGPWWARRF